MSLKIYLNVLDFIMLLPGGKIIDTIGQRHFLRQNNKPLQGKSQVNLTSAKTYQVIQGEIYER